LVRNVIDRIVAQNSYGYVESWRYLYDIYFLGLVGYEAAKFVKDYDVGVVLAFLQKMCHLHWLPRNGQGVELV